MTRPAAIYARVSSDRQKENHTICSQLAALVEYAGSHGYLVPPEWRFQDEGFSGATLLRPGLEKTPILQALQASDSENDSHDAGNQLILFDF